MDIPTAGQIANNLKGVDASRFYRVERYCDPEVQTFEVRIPVKLDGSPDLLRKTRYYSSIVIAYGGQSYSREFEIEADSLEEAITKFTSSASQVGHDTIASLADADAARRLLTAQDFGVRQ